MCVKCKKHGVVYQIFFQRGPREKLDIHNLCAECCVSILQHTLWNAEYSLQDHVLRHYVVGA